MKVVILGLAILTALWCSSAQADAIFTLGNNPQADEENILLNSGATGSTVFGETNKTHITVNFSSTTDNLTEPSSGQATIEAEEGLINNITISLPGGTFGDLIINPTCPPGSGDCGDATVSALTNDGTFTFTYPLGPGQNFLTITTSGGERLVSVSIDDPSPDGFDQLSQVRISGVTGNPVPEPSTMLLLGSGLIGLAGFIRRKFKK
jgi:hypothetical protein